MSENYANIFSGSILYWKKGAVPLSLLTGVFSAEKNSLLELMSWEEYSFTANDPITSDDLLYKNFLIREDRSGEIPKTYSYNFIARRSGQKLLLLARQREIISYVISKSPLRHISPKLSPQRIDIDSMIKWLINNRSIYRLTYSHAEMDFQKGFMDRLSFYGDEMIKSDFFRYASDKMTFVSCGLSLVENHEKREVARLGAKGNVSVALTCPDSYRNLENALGFVKTMGFFINPSDWDDGDMPW